MKFHHWLESFVFHGSQLPIMSWDSSRHASGYYPGFYAWNDPNAAKRHGANVYELQIDDSAFYTITDADMLKREAKKAGFPSTNGSGFQDVQYLKSQGYKGIKRGNEYIIFNPEEWSPTPKLHN